MARLRTLEPLINSPAYRTQQGDASPATDAVRAKVRSLALDGSPTLAASELRALRRLGEGGFAEVELCEVLSEAVARFGPRLATAPRGPGGGALVAVKWLKTHIVADPGPLATSERKHIALPAHEVSNFFAEAALLRSLEHPSVITAHGCYLLNGRGALILEYCAGGTLAERVRKGKGYASAEGLRWLIELARALEYIHTGTGFTIAHRDLKPENVLLDGAGRVRLADFGLSRLLPLGADGPPPVAHSTSAPSLSLLFSAEPSHPPLALGQRDIRHAVVTGRTGSSRFMAPENWRGEQYTANVDVFSFGVIAWEVLSAQRAYSHMHFTGEQVAEYVANKGLRPPVPEAWPHELRQLISQCWAEDKTARPSMAIVAPALAALGKRSEADATILRGVLAPRQVSPLAGISRFLNGHISKGVAG